MKPLLLPLILVIFLFVNAHAQDSTIYLGAGRSLIGGGLSLGLSSTEDNDGNMPANGRTTETSYFTISPNYGRFYNERWMMGVALTLGYRHEVINNSGQDFLDKSTQRFNSVAITPFLRRFCPVTPRFGVFVQPELFYRYNRINSQSEFRNGPTPGEPFSSTIRSHAGGAATQLGLYYFITPHLSLETNLLRAVLTSTREKMETDNGSNGNEPTSRSFDLQLRLINELSLNQILVLNYYF